MDVDPSGTHKVRSLSLAVVLVVMLVAGCFGPAGPAATHSDPGWLLGSLMLYVAPSGSVPDQSAIPRDIDPSGVWLAFSTSAANVGPHTASGDCDSPRPGAGCVLNYVATFDGKALLPIVLRQGNVQSDDTFLSTALAQGARVVAFTTVQDGVDPRDENGSDDAFRWDRVSGEVRWLTTPVDDAAKRKDRCMAFCGHSSITPTGDAIVIASNATDLTGAPASDDHQVFLWTAAAPKDLRLLSATPHAHPGNGQSWTRGTQSISDDGRWVVFTSRASNLVSPPLATSGTTHVFLHDTTSGTNHLLSQRSDGSPFVGGGSIPAIDPTGRWVVFYAAAQEGGPGASATKVVHLLDRSTGGRRVISAPDGVDVAGTTSWLPSISRDATHVTFTSDARLLPQDTDDQLDVYLWQRASETLTMVSDPRLPNALPGLATSAVVAENGLRVLFRWEDHVDVDPPWDKVSRVVWRDIVG